MKPEDFETTTDWLPKITDPDGLTGHLLDYDHLRVRWDPGHARFTVIAAERDGVWHDIEPVNLNYGP